MSTKKAASAGFPPSDAQSHIHSQVNTPEPCLERQRPRKEVPRWQALYSRLGYVPPWCRYDPDHPTQFSISLNILFAFAGCFTVANLYYSHPILNKLARDFDVTDEQASYIPTLAQAGYAAGLLLICPLGDLLKRRPFVLWLVWFTATLWIGLCVTKSFAAFCAISFVTSVTTVTPQLMLPLVGDLAPPHRRSTALSIVVSGMLLGMLIARLLSGVVTEFIGWRYIYWIAFGLQYLILILLFLCMPDYPSTNPDMDLVRKYPGLLFDILRLPFKYPVLVQACLIGFFTSSIFTSYWTTLTFLLAGGPYHYSSLLIGLFALIGIGSMTWGPVFARTVMEKHEPLFSILIGESICLAGVIIGTYTGLHTVAGPIIQAACIDIGLQTSQIANRTAIFGVEPKGRNRVNTAYMVSVFCGQLMGTAAGNHLYAQGGWVRSGSASVGFVCAALVICILRGPHETGWVGWGGGYKMRKLKILQQPHKDEEKGAVEEKSPQPFTSDQTRKDNSRNEQHMVLDEKSSEHSVGGNASEKTLTTLEDASSPGNPTKVTETMQNENSGALSVRRNSLSGSATDL